MSDKTLRIIVSVVLGAGLVVVAVLLRGREQPSATPDAREEREDREARKAESAAAATVSDFFDAAGRGDERRYLELVDGELKRSLAAELEEEGAKAFRVGLRRTVAGIKGLATMPNSDAPDGMVALDVDIVFADRIENQRILLAPKGSGWAIVSIDAAQMSKPPIPYGTPVFEEPGGQPEKSPSE